MKKSKLTCTLSAVLAASLLVSACGQADSAQNDAQQTQQSQQEETQTENNQSSTELTDEEKQMFATGSSGESADGATEGGAADAGASEGTSSEAADDGASTSSSEAAGEASSEAAGEEKKAPDLSWFSFDDSIEEICPTKASMNRANVKKGQFVHETYFSSTCQMDRGVSVLLPDDYSESGRYQVLYMLHGIFGDEYSFANDSGNGIKSIVANLVSDGIIEDTIVVCPNMYATSDPNLHPGFTNEEMAPYDNFANDLVNDLMPFIEATYPVYTDREHTLLAGFSMGGRETLYISHLYPELFGYVCSISAAPGLTPGQDWAMVHPGSLTEDELVYPEGVTVPNVLMLCCGTKDSVVGTFPLSYHDIMERNGVTHIWYEIEGADHDNTAIKSGLYNLFKQMAYDKGYASAQKPDAE